MIADVHAVPLLLAILATYRISFLVTSEDGPFGLAQRWREWFVDPKTRTARWPDHEWIMRGVHCVLCVSFWLSLIPTALFVWLYALPLHVALLLWLGISGGVLVLARAR